MAPREEPKEIVKRWAGTSGGYVNAEFLGMKEVERKGVLKHLSSLPEGLKIREEVIRKLSGHRDIRKELIKHGLIEDKEY
ncbi:MAG: hypothetical protein J7L23_04810 [Candidatus Diapherotrites archaeon]|nr:hypothetical protein [Candidatus Diapherotrites archaeon]